MRLGAAGTYRTQAITPRRTASIEARWLNPSRRFAVPERRLDDSADGHTVGTSAAGPP